MNLPGIILSTLNKYIQVTKYQVVQHLTMSHVAECQRRKFCQGFKGWHAVILEEYNYLGCEYQH